MAALQILHDVPESRSGRRPWVTRRTLQLALGVVWTLDGALQLQPFMFTRGFAERVILPSASGEPLYVRDPVQWASAMILAHPVVWDALFALVQLGIGGGLLFKRTVRPALALSIGWALGVWLLGEGLGGLAAGATTFVAGAPGAVVLYAVIGLAAWPPLGARGRQRVLGRGHRPRARVHAALSRCEDAAPAPWVPAAWGLVWGLFALLQALPANSSGVALGREVLASAAGAPNWLVHVQHWVARDLVRDGTGIVAAMVLVELAIGVLGILPWRFRIVAAWSGIAVALAVWVVGQGFGQIPTGMGTDPSSGPLVGLLGVALLGIPPRATLDRASGRARVALVSRDDRNDRNDRNDRRRIADAGESAPAQTPWLVDQGRVERPQLGDVAPDVLAAGIESPSLARRAQHPVRVRPGAAPGHPLPVQVVERDVRVHEVRQEVARSVLPALPQVPREEGGRDHPGTVREVALRQQLPHGGVHDRHARETAAPCVEPDRIASILAAPVDEVGPRRVRTRREELKVEVAPAQLAQERRRSGQVGEGGLDPQRGERAEVQVCGETGGRRIGEVVPLLPVAGERSLPPGGEACPGGPLPTGRDPGGGTGGWPGAGGRPGEGAGRGGGKERAPGDSQPPTVEGREDAVVVTPRRRDGTGGHDGEAGGSAHLGGPAGGGLEPTKPTLGVRRHVVARVDRPRPGLRRESQDLVHPASGPLLEPSATLPERRVEVGETVGEKPGSERMHRGAGSQRGVVDEHADDP